MPSPHHRSKSKSTQPPAAELAAPAATVPPVEEATSESRPVEPPSTGSRPARGRTGTQRAEGRFRAMLELVSDALVASDLEGRIVFVNRQTEALFAYAREELLGQQVDVLIPPRFHAAYQQHRAQCVATPRTRTMGTKTVSLFGRRRDGSEFSMEISLSPLDLDDEDDGVMGERLVVSSIRDVSELQRLQADNVELRAVQVLADATLSPLALDDLMAALLERLLTVMGVDHVALLLLEADGQQLAVHAARGLGEDVAAQMHLPLGQGFAGRIVATRQPLTVEDLSSVAGMDPLLREPLSSAVGVPLVMAGRLVGVLQAGTVTARQFGDGDVRLLALAGARLARVIDYTRLLEAEQAARHEAERERVRWQAAMDSVPELVATCDADLRVTYVNPAYEGLRGSPADPSVPPEERAARYGLLTPDGTGLFPPEQRPLARALREGQPVRGVEMMHRTPTGEERLVEWEAAPMRMAQGTLLGAVAIGHDITERTQLEREREQARAEAEQQAAQLAATFEAMADGVAVFDAQGRLVRENAAQQRLLGLDAAPPGYADLPLSERMALFAARDEHGRPLDPEEGPLPRALRGEVVSGAETMDLCSRALDGRELELNVSAAPLQDREGHLTGVVAVFRDQTERKRLERERAEQAEQLNRIFDGIADGLMVYDAQGRLVRFNLAAQCILGLDALPPNYFDRPMAERATPLFAPRDEQGRPLAHEDWPLMRVLHEEATGPEARDIRAHALDGRELELTISAAPLHDQEGRLVGAVNIVHDRTERKRLEQEREAARAHELALQAVTRHMDEFLATAAHDLRTPLTVVKNGVQLARRRFERLRDSALATQTAVLPDAELEAIYMSLLGANQSADRLTRLVGLLFDVAQAQSGTLKLQLAPCNLMALVREQVRAQSSAAPERTIALVVPDTPDTSPLVVLADADRLGQVLGNYLTNALKYSAEDRPVDVRLEAADGEVRVAVRDAGPGLPEAERNRVWEPFHRVPGIEVRSRVESGSMGLGLHICQRIIELHHGRVGVDSQVGQGSTFWFTLALFGSTS